MNAENRSSTAVGIDYLTVTKKFPSASIAREALRKSTTQLKFDFGDERKQHGFVGQDVLAGRGFIGIAGNRAIIELPGQAIDALRAKGIQDDALLAILAPWRASRVDFCVDTRNKAITPAVVAQAWHKGHVTSRADTIKEITSQRADGKASHTTYIGSADSVRMLRVYDKATQMEFVHGVKGLPPWTRFELQHRHEAAEAAHKHLTRHGLESGKQLMNGWITFHDPKSRAKNVHRRKLAKWWAEIVGEKKAHSGWTRGH